MSNKELFMRDREIIADQESALRRGVLPTDPEKKKLYDFVRDVETTLRERCALFQLPTEIAQELISLQLKAAELIK